MHASVLLKFLKYALLHACYCSRVMPRHLIQGMLPLFCCAAGAALKWGNSCLALAPCTLLLSLWFELLFETPPSCLGRLFVKAACFVCGQGGRRAWFCIANTCYSLSAPSGAGGCRGYDPLHTVWHNSLKLSLCLGGCCNPPAPFRVVGWLSGLVLQNTTLLAQAPPSAVLMAHWRSSSRAPRAALPVWAAVWQAYLFEAGRQGRWGTGTVSHQPTQPFPFLPCSAGSLQLPQPGCPAVDVDWYTWCQGEPCPPPKLKLFDVRI